MSSGFSYMQLLIPSNYRWDANQGIFVQPLPC